ncbi:A disintegrin and metalloproteinase with thrombospondin motifs adt-2-like [Aphidius gifuensis]|uniref:A disintegrin and metalloproteinase with thrombospondin motifs adt-2-like n=1 Tax=Aphidius gifuensis TaxID=684658 RepID=UPI001CDC74E9|nr:A disintegrin and metalloproteinase with thrombospondin motifs adt-2-like [Aphidius gifuensis]
MKIMESPESKPIIEVLCFIDYDTYKLHAGEKTGGEADKEVEDYFLPFWKNVDHYLSLLNIRISLKGIIIAHTREEENVFLNSQKNRLFADAFNSTATLSSLGKYIYSNKNLPTHDLAIVVTQSVLCNEKELKKDKTRKLKKSFKKNSCQDASDVANTLKWICIGSDDKEATSTSVAIIRDQNKMYKGVRNAVFAIGRSLGISMDGAKDDDDAKKCKSEDGYFMSGNTNFHLPYKFKWSNCSVQSFNNKHSLIYQTMWYCLFETTNEKVIDFSKAPFPGEILSLDNYCKKLTDYKACSYDDVCTSLTCSSGEDCGRTIKGPAIEGSWCGSNETSTMRCEYGKCVPFSSNKLKENNALENMFQYFTSFGYRRYMAREAHNKMMYAK